MPTLDQGGKGITNSDFDVSITNSTIKNLQQILIYYDKQSKVVEKITKNNSNSSNAMKLMAKLEEDRYKKATLDERKLKNEKLKSILEEKQAELDAKIEVDALSISLSKKDKKRFKDDADAELAYRKKLAREANATEIESLNEQKRILKEQNDANEKALKIREKNLSNLLGLTGVGKKMDSKQKSLEADLEAKKEAYEKAKENGASDEELAAREKDVLKAENRRDNFKEFTDKIEGAINNGLSNIAKAFDSAVSRAESALVDNYGRINARLEGTIYNFGDIIDHFNNALAMSPYVKQEAILRKITEAVDSGIAYNVEQRAFLQTVSENIVSTFDAFNSNLTRIIRIQQADSTAARLGLEASLKELLNTQYADTSYLNDSFDAVSEALIEATAQMSKENAVEFEYTVQKWLGALSSLGLSQQGVSRIATGLGYLNSGDVQQLASDSQLQTLLAMSASRAGLNYGEKLTTGLTSDETNKLLRAMVEYLSEIASDTAENRVVRSAYGDVFNLSVSDIRAVSNITDTIETIYNSQRSYQSLMNETANQMNQIYDRMSLAQLYSNVTDNASFGLGSSIVNNSFAYGLYKAVDTLDDLSGGFDMLLAPFGVGVSTNIFDTVKTAMAGIGMIGQLISAMGNATWDTGSLVKVGLLSGYDTVGDATVNTRGTFLESMLSTESGTSASSQITNSSSDDVMSESVSSASQQQEEISSLTSDDDREEVDMKDLFYGLLSGTDARDVLGTMNSNIEDIIEEIRRFGFFASGLSLDEFVSTFRASFIDSQPSITIKSLVSDLSKQLFGDSGEMRSGFPSVVSSLSTSTLVTSAALKAIEDSIRLSYNGDNYQNVYIAGIGDSLGHDLPISFSSSQGMAGKPGWQQVSDYLADMKATLGYSSNGGDASSSTLKDLAEFMVKTVGSNEEAGVGEGGLKVGLTSVNVSLSDMATVGTPWDYTKGWSYTKGW